MISICPRQQHHQPEKSQHKRSPPPTERPPTTTTKASEEQPVAPLCEELSSLKRIITHRYTENPEGLSLHTRAIQNYKTPTHLTS